jgi:hypothetical protein
VELLSAYLAGNPSGCSLSGLNARTIGRDGFFIWGSSPVLSTTTQRPADTQKQSRNILQGLCGFKRPIYILSFFSQFKRMNNTFHVGNYNLEVM